MKRIQRAVKEVERDLKRKGRRREKAGSDDMDEVLDQLVFSLGDSLSTSNRESEMDSSMEDIPELPRDWKVRLREKVMRNIEASVHDLHVRCEVPSPEGTNETGQSPAGSRHKLHDSALAIGFTMDSLVVRTASEKWEVGRHDKRGGSVPQSEQDHLGPNPYEVHNNKIGYFRGLSVYFDEDPPVLLSQTDALMGNQHKLPTDKIQHRVGKAMEEMIKTQCPSDAICEDLAIDSSE